MITNSYKENIMDSYCYEDEIADSLRKIADSVAEGKYGYDELEDFDSDAFLEDLRCVIRDVAGLTV